MLHITSFLNLFINFFTVFIDFYLSKRKIILDSNEKINIVHLTRKFDIKNLGGIEEGIIQLCKSNKSEKFNNYVFACGDTPKDFKIHNINVKLFKTSFILFNSHISLDLILYLIKNYKSLRICIYILLGQLNRINFSFS